MPERILIYGVTGSGKTTLAGRVERATGLPWHDVDELTWQPGWVAVPAERQRELVAAICAQERWILDSGYASWLDLVLDRAELIVALDYPRWVSLGRLLRRTAARVVDRRPICNGNVETLRQAFGADSIIRWHFRSFGHKHDRILRWAADPSVAPVVRLTSPRQTERWLAGLAGGDTRH